MRHQVRLSNLPKPNNELVGPQQAKKVVDEGIFHVLVPLKGVAAVGVIGTLLYLSSAASLHCKITSIWSLDWHHEWKNHSTDCLLSYLFTLQVMLRSLTKWMCSYTETISDTDQNDKV